jgi:hypothetical protein
VILTMVDRRTRLARTSATRCGGTSATSSSDLGAALGARRRGAEPRLPVTAYDRDSAGADAYWKVAMELVGRS